MGMRIESVHKKFSLDRTRYAYDALNKVPFQWVYALWDDPMVSNSPSVYIGKSEVLGSRMNGHRSTYSETGMRYLAFGYQRDHDYSAIEAVLIDRHRPRDNRMIPMPPVDFTMPMPQVFAIGTATASRLQHGAVLLSDHTLRVPESPQDILIRNADLAVFAQPKMSLHIIRSGLGSAPGQEFSSTDLRELWGGEYLDHRDRLVDAGMATIRKVQGGPSGGAPTILMHLNESVESTSSDHHRRVQPPSASQQPVLQR